MLNVYLGNFHPDLEETLCKNITTLKDTDPMAPMAIVVPSDRIRSRIKLMLAKERGINLMGVHFLTFHSLCVRLYQERYGLIKRLIGDDFFFIEFIRYLLKTGVTGADTFRHFSETPEGCATLWATIQDMTDAKVEPDNVIEAMREGVFSSEDIEKIAPLILFYKEFLLRKKAIDITDFSDLPEIAAELVPSSQYLHSFKEIIYYGFYDLTQVQYDLFRIIVQHYHATLYFPLIDKMPAFSFARRFFEGYIQGIVSSQEKMIRLSEPVITGSGNGTLFPFGHISSVISTSGAEDEIITVAKGILNLVDNEGYSFSDIGVVARETDDYGHLIKRIFDVHKIPFVSSANEPVNMYQITKAVNLLISIPEGNYRRSDIIDLVSSHYCNIRSFCPDSIEPRPDIWDIVTRSIGVSKGINEWNRLDKYITDGFIIHGEKKDEDEGEKVIGAQLEGLMSFVQSVSRDFSDLPEVSSWGNYVERFMMLIQRYVEIDNYIKEALLFLKEFDLIKREVSLTEFTDTFRRKLERMYVPVEGRDIDGVQVLDVMAARCIPFKVLFIPGMNEKVFPRNIREDPLLRDSARGVMERGLGYKISEKLYGFEEEKLLFYMLLSSAGERIYILYQRTDDSGQIKVPSWYLSEIKRGYPVKEERVPRRLPDKFSLSGFFTYTLLTPRELSIRLILEGRDPGPIISKFNLNPALYEHGFKTIQLYEEMRPNLTEFDGLTGGIDVHWDKILQKGVSPTSLEMYARCPFSYFAEHVLGLRRLTQPELVFEIPPADIGSICHKILKRFYTRGVDTVKMDIDRYLEDDAVIVFNEFRETNPAGYPLVWVVLQKRLFEILKSIIKADLHEIASSGFVPHSFEVDVIGYFTQNVPENMRDTFVHGVLDRIDLRPDTGQFRIIDYKFKSGKRINSDDKNLLLSAVRGKRLQPPLYLLMATPYLKFTAGIEDPKPEKVSFYFIAPGWSLEGDAETISEFPGDCWQSSLGEGIQATVALLIKGIKDGLFFILPGSYCDNCDYSTICRKNHFPSSWRAEKDEKVRPYHAIRQEKIKS